MSDVSSYARRYLLCNSPLNQLSWCQIKILPLGSYIDYQAFTCSVWPFWGFEITRVACSLLSQFECHFKMSLRSIPIQFTSLRAVDASVIEKLGTQGIHFSNLMLILFYA